MINSTHQLKVGDRVTLWTGQYKRLDLALGEVVAVTKGHRARVRVTKILVPAEHWRYRHLDGAEILFNANKGTGDVIGVDAYGNRSIRAVATRNPYAGLA